jgi:integrase
VSLHDLRHTHATFLLDAGVDLKTISARLGHSSIALTADTYAHVTEQLDREAAARLERYLNREIVRVDAEQDTLVR